MRLTNLPQGAYPVIRSGRGPHRSRLRYDRPRCGTTPLYSPHHRSARPHRASRRTITSRFSGVLLITLDWPAPTHLHFWDSTDHSFPFSTPRLRGHEWISCTRLFWLDHAGTSRPLLHFRNRRVALDKDTPRDFLGSHFRAPTVELFRARNWTFTGTNHSD